MRGFFILSKSHLILSSRFSGVSKDAPRPLSNFPRPFRRHRRRHLGLSDAVLERIEGTG